ncbi:MAG: hypothetical protein EOM14_00550 [Clostridia bacterium]|nr:hypothetical protein [Clostridia bacterium]
MKAKTSVIAAIITLAAVITGFFMPGLVCGIQDIRRDKQVINRETGSVQLVFENTVALTDKLMLIKNGYSRVDIKTGMNLDKSGAQDAATAVLIWLEQYDFYPGTSDAEVNTCVPFLASSSDDTALSAIFWECDFQDSYGNLVKLIIDDEKGMMMAFAYSWVLHDSDETMSVNTDETISINTFDTESIIRFGSICADYYDFSEWDIPDMKYYVGNTEAVYLFVDENGEKYEIPFSTTANYFSFNS